MLSSNVLIALHLLCLTQLTKTMVLFTANIEDLKKLARRFVSDNMAEQLADLILKASNGLKPAKISEENDKNVKSIEDVSENKIVRAGEDTEDRNTKVRKLGVKKTHSNKPSIYRHAEVKVTRKEGVIINVNWDERKKTGTEKAFESNAKLNDAKENKMGFNMFSDDNRFGDKNDRYGDDGALKYNDGEGDIVATSGAISLPKLRNTWR